MFNDYIMNLMNICLKHSDGEASLAPAEFADT